MKNSIGIVLILGGVALMALGPAMLGPWWMVGGFAAFVVGFMVVMDAAKSRRFAQAMRTNVATGGEGSSSGLGGFDNGGGSGDSGGGDH